MHFPGYSEPLLTSHPDGDLGVPSPIPSKEGAYLMQQQSKILTLSRPLRLMGVCTSGEWSWVLGEDGLEIVSRSTPPHLEPAIQPLASRIWFLSQVQRL